jgi:hypothetical protein
MCYSGLVQEDWRAFVKRTGLTLSLPAFFELFVNRKADPAEYRLPRGFELEFSHLGSEEDRAIKAQIDEHPKAQTAKLETGLFALRKRLSDGERTLAVKETKAAVESKRIATNKIQQALGKLALLKDDRKHANDYRIFPRSCAPMVVMRAAKKLLVPPRYLLRQPGAPAFMDDKLSGNYNTRRDNLTRSWRRQFGVSHALMPVKGFFRKCHRPGWQQPGPALQSPARADHADRVPVFGVGRPEVKGDTAELCGGDR